MKKPQCEKPTSYNCGEACINVAKGCKQFPSDSISRQRLQKLKELAVYYSKSKTVKAKKSGEATGRLIGAISEERSKQVGELKQFRAEVNKERNKARLKAQAKQKREELLELYDKLGSSPATAKLVSNESPEKRIQKLKASNQEKINKLRRSDPLEAERMSKVTAKNIQTLEKEFKGFLEESRKLVEVDNPTKVNATIDKNIKNVKAHQNGIDAFSRLIDVPDLKDSVAITAAPPERKGRSCYKSGKNIVQSGVDDPATIVHEMAHWLEEKVPGVREEVVAFYNKRTAGEKTVKMSEATGNPSYRDNETTKVDKWLNPYMGKEYKNASEILSMGLEMMHRNPVYLAKNDPEMFDFIYSVVRRR